MFKSKARPIVVPQWEHARLSGILASLWGNEAFDRPAFDSNAFILGVTMHDRGYGILDDRAIGELAPDLWIETQRDGILDTDPDPIVNVIALMHMRRLLRNSDAPGRETLIMLADQHILESRSQTGLTAEQFEWTDSITRWCDSVAFDFSFEAQMHNDMSVCRRWDSPAQTVVRHHLSDGGVIRVDPWPFSVTHYAGFIVGYQVAGYPDRLRPQLLPFSLVPAESQ